MARLPGARVLSDAFQRARSEGAKPARVSLILNGVKYKSGQNPVRVCPQGNALGRTIATLLR